MREKYDATGDGNDNRQVSLVNKDLGPTGVIVVDSTSRQGRRPFTMSPEKLVFIHRRTVSNFYYFYLYIFEYTILYVSRQHSPRPASPCPCL